MSKNNLSRRVEDLEQVNDPNRIYVRRIIWHSDATAGLDDVFGPYRETRSLFIDDGSPKGRPFRQLKQGELLEGVSRGMTPWLLRDQELNVKPPIDLATASERHGARTYRQEDTLYV